MPHFTPIKTANKLFFIGKKSIIMLVLVFCIFLMNILIITAQPSKSGFIHQIAKQYEGTSKTQGNTVEMLDLYDEEWQMPFLSFESMKDITLTPTVLRIQEKVRSADKIVFAFPMWWSEYPAIVKNWVDNILTAGFAFEYQENGIPKGLLTGKTAEVYMTCDAPRWMYFFFGFPFKKLFTKKILGFCGICTTRFHLYGSASKLSAEKKAKILQKITSIALS